MWSITVVNIVLCCLIHIIGIVVFLVGFFPLKPTVHDSASVVDRCFSLNDECCKDNVTTEQGNDCFLQPVYGRLVIILIDALRTDFVLPEIDMDGKFTMCTEPKMSIACRHIVNSRTAALYATAHPPTVTMPRIKVSHSLNVCLK